MLQISEAQIYEKINEIISYTDETILKFNALDFTLKKTNDEILDELVVYDEKNLLPFENEDNADYLEAVYGTREYTDEIAEIERQNWEDNRAYFDACDNEDKEIIIENRKTSLKADLAQWIDFSNILGKEDTKNQIETKNEALKTKYILEYKSKKLNFETLDKLKLYHYLLNIEMSTNDKINEEEDKTTGLPCKEYDNLFGTDITTKNEIWGFMIGLKMINEHGAWLLGTKTSFLKSFVIVMQKNLKINGQSETKLIEIFTKKLFGKSRRIHNSKDEEMIKNFLNKIKKE